MIQRVQGRGRSASDNRQQGQAQGQAQGTEVHCNALENAFGQRLFHLLTCFALSRLFPFIHDNNPKQ